MKKKSTEEVCRVVRETAETQIKVALRLGGGAVHLDVPDGFFGHMLDALARHSRLGLEVSAQGDTHIDLHHTVEDTGIVIGEALRTALGDRAGIERFGDAYVPLDEALARAVIDLSGRGFFAWQVPPEIETSWVTKEFPFTLVADFLQALADRGRFTLHLDILRARNPHHAAEAAFKAVAVALRRALDRTGSQQVPSTKGTLTA